MITADQALARYGDPKKERGMEIWWVPGHINLSVVPRKIYLNKDLRAPLLCALENIINRGMQDELRTWDGCFNIRPSKGSSKNYSLHAWGLAVDINAAWNGWDRKPTISRALVQCFLDAGFDWGGNWPVKDGMHFQLAKLPEAA